MTRLPLLFLLLLALPAQAIFAQPAAPAAEDPAHAELRALKDAVVTAFNKGNMDGIMPYVHKNAVFTPLNAEVCHGIDAIRAYNDKMMKGANAIVSDVKVDLKVDDLAELYGGDTAVAWGSIAESFKLTQGLQFTSNDRWSATLVKEDGKWLIASFHTSCNIFDNPLLNAAKKSAVIAGIAAGLIGLLAGLIIARMAGRKNKAAPAPASA